MSLSRDNFKNKTTKYSSDLIKRGLDLAIKIDSSTKKDCLVDDDSLVNLEEDNDELNSFDFDDWYDQGNELYYKQKYQEAIALFDKVIKIDSSFDPAWYQRGQSLYYLEQYQEAIASFDKALEINPKYELAWYWQGMALSGLKQYQEAISSFDQAIKIDPEDDSNWYWRGLALFGLYQYQEALASFNKALEIKPWNNNCAKFAQGMASYCLEQYQEAISSFDDAIDSQEGQSIAQILGLTLCEYREYQQKLKEIDETFDALSDKPIKLDPTYDLFWYWRGRALTELKRYSEAIASFNKVIEIDPEGELAKDSQEKIELIEKLKLI